MSTTAIIVYSDASSNSEEPEEAQDALRSTLTDQIIALGDVSNCPVLLASPLHGLLWPDNIVIGRNVQLSALRKIEREARKGMMLAPAALELMLRTEGQARSGVGVVVASGAGTCAHLWRVIIVAPAELSRVEIADTMTAFGFSEVVQIRSSPHARAIAELKNVLSTCGHQAA